MLTGVVAILAALTVLLGLQACSRTVEGQAQRAGAGDVPRNNDSEKQYPNLLKECDVLTQDILAKTDGLDAFSTIVGFSVLTRVTAPNNGFYFVGLKPWGERGEGLDARSIAVTEFTSMSRFGATLAAAFAPAPAAGGWNAA